MRLPWPVFHGLRAGATQPVESSRGVPGAQVLTMLTNVTFSLLSFFSSIVIAFFLSPYILKQLGPARYGIWALFGEMLSYYGLLDLGIRTALNYYVGRSLAHHRSEDVGRYVSSAFAGLIGASTLAFLISCVLVWLFRGLLVKGAADPVEVLTAAVLFLLIFCVGLPMEMYAAVLVGSRHQYIVSGSEIVSRLVSSLLMFLGLVWKPGMPVLVASQLAGKLIYWASIYRGTRRIVPEATVKRRMISWSALKDLVRYGSQNAFINISWVLIGRKDVTLITFFHSPALVPNYSFARLLVQSLNHACLAITQALRPNLIYHLARQEHDQTYSIYDAGTRYSSYLVLCCTAFLAVYGSEFMSLWIGPRFVAGPLWMRADFVLYLLLLSYVPRMMQSNSRQLLFAANKQRSLSVLLVCESILNLLLTIPLVQSHGVAGLALGAAVPMFISDVVVLPQLMKRLVSVSPRRYLSNGIGRPLAVSAVLVLFGIVLKPIIPPLHWGALLADAGLVGLLALALGWLFVIRPEDRRLVLATARAWTVRKSP